jgi:3-deoxy-D-manno-octulosonate 8-phosphate phosphatase (KDO 8-P phosphatase)
LKKSFPSLDQFSTIALDFDGVFTDNKVYVDQHGVETVRCDRADGLAFDFIRKLEREGSVVPNFFILSKEPNPVVLARAKKLKLKCHHGIADKVDFMEDYLGDEGFSKLLYVGNDLNDLPLLLKSGYSISPCDAHPMVKSSVDYVSEKKGGDGFVRDVVEKLIGFEKMSLNQIKKFI